MSTRVLVLIRAYEALWETTKCFTEINLNDVDNRQICGNVDFNLEKRIKLRIDALCAIVVLSKNNFPLQFHLLKD